MLRSTSLVALLAIATASTGCARHLTRSDRVAAVVVGSVLVGTGLLVMNSHSDSSESYTRAGELDYGDVGSQLVALPLLALGAGAIFGGLIAPSAPEPAPTSAAHAKLSLPPTVIKTPAPAYQ